MNILIFDTETTSLDKPFCYDIGYNIVNVESGESLLQRSFVIEQVWHNLALFSSSYYADKRPLYISEMKAKRTKMSKFGYIMRTLQADIKNFEIEFAYAYNSNFDERVFEFNCDWYKVSNPFDNIPIIDIRPFAFNYICNKDIYKDFCEYNNRFTESQNYSTTAETVYQYITMDENFIESHTGLQDALIETDILLLCYKLGADITKKEKCKKSLTRETDKILTIKLDKEIIAEFECKNYTVYKTRDTIILKG